MLYGSKNLPFYSVDKKPFVYQNPCALWAEVYNSCPDLESNPVIYRRSSPAFHEHCRGSWKDESIPLVELTNGTRLVKTTGVQSCSYFVNSLPFNCKWGRYTARCSIQWRNSSTRLLITIWKVVSSFYWHIQLLSVLHCKTIVTRCITHIISFVTSSFNTRILVC